MFRTTGRARLLPRVRPFGLTVQQYSSACWQSLPRLPGAFQESLSQRKHTTRGWFVPRVCSYCGLGCRESMAADAFGRRSLTLISQPQLSARCNSHRWPVFDVTKLKKRGESYETKCFDLHWKLSTRT